MIPVTHEILEEITHGAVSLVLDKNAMYRDAWRRRGLHGITVRLEDNLARIEALIDGDALRDAADHGERIEDTITDMIGYLLLARIRVDELRAEAQETEESL